MKRIMMRAPSSPFDNPSYYDVFRDNLIGGNSGNMIFLHSVSRALMTEDTEIDYYFTNRDFEDSEAEQFNERYDAFVIPLANAFRPSFMGELRRITALIRRLTIPCIVVGVGIKSDRIGKEPDTSAYDEYVREFCDAVLEKSDSIGLRGEITAEYLKKLGYTEGEDFTVIGCPSMYLYGEELPKPKELSLTEDSKISVNCKISLPNKVQAYMRKTCKQIRDHYYIVQNLYEMQTLFLGRNVISSAGKFENVYKNYPVDYKHPLYKRNKVRAFVSVEPWFEFLKERDLSFGTRIHGNIAAILSGIPSYIIAPDNRVLELAEFHNIPHTTIQELDTKKDIFELLDGVDFSSVLDGHSERFRNYIDFLHSNGLSTIFDSEDYGKTECKFDRKISEIKFRPPMEQSIRMSYKYQIEAANVWDMFIGLELEKNQTMREERTALREERKELINNNRALNRELSRLKKRHCGRISVSVGRWTVNFFKRKLK